MTYEKIAFVALTLTALVGCVSATPAQESKITALEQVKYFQAPKPHLPKGTYETRLQAAIGGVLTIDENGCLRLGDTVPILHGNITVGVDDVGFFIISENGGKKYRLGDAVRGGGGGGGPEERLNNSGKNGATIDICSSDYMPGFYF